MSCLLFPENRKSYSISSSLRSLPAVKRPGEVSPNMFFMSHSSHRQTRHANIYTVLSCNFVGNRFRVRQAKCFQSVCQETSHLVFQFSLFGLWNPKERNVDIQWLIQTNIKTYNLMVMCLQQYSQCCALLWVKAWVGWGKVLSNVVKWYCVTVIVLYHFNLYVALSAFL